jgi:hypothetical protein
VALYDFARTEKPCQRVKQFAGQAVASLTFSPGASPPGLGFGRRSLSHGVLGASLARPALLVT